ncbi:hypothetical protein PHYSODRAFT_299896 [Phytophthora sojae]|uniref:Uncharacterized protein n=1 Tax=Phytophthora sojae (strain P6497) TaxID=1094619 RepID=G4ZC25_PHYSP|nr:hypothetical protein PHYSODRAFT_299896 [Phytophthora sojae]EGZ22755.1 hypothetical protein PHYSODRAFT_299896 [Phytophthora sojae]|eukprot:XP_009525472.1 hypothetical protein PHYSODRAFT_299896 [Phytophthora sojae]
MPQTRFLFADFDDLHSAVREHLRLQPAVFGTDDPICPSPVDFAKLAILLSGRDAVVACQRGVFRESDDVDERLVSAAGWSTRRKRQTLEEMLKRNLAEAVLALGKLRKSTVKILEAYIAANWRVQLFCLRRSNMETVNRLRAGFSSRFHNVYLDRLMKGFLRPASVASAESPNQEDAQQSSQAMPPADNFERFVIMDLDNISDTLSNSTSLYREVPQASSSRELRIDFRKLTLRVCGGDLLKVKRQMAVYHSSHPLLVQALMSLQFLAQLISADTDTPKTLVLVMGDNGLDTSGKAAYTGMLEVLLAQQWQIEVHAWVDSLGDVFSELLKKYPDGVQVKPLDEALQSLRQIPRDDPGSNGNSLEAISTNQAADVELSSLQQQIQELARAVTDLRSVSSPQTATQLVELEQRLNQQEQEFARRLCEQQDTFSMQCEQLAQQAHNARQYHRIVLQQREEMLTCPITHCLFESPVIAACCGKTFSKAAVDILQTCLWCREARGFVTHPNRDIANLVEQYRMEFNALELA